MVVKRPARESQDLRVKCGLKAGWFGGQCNDATSDRKSPMWSRVQAIIDRMVRIEHPQYTEDVLWDGASMQEELLTRRSH